MAERPTSVSPAPLGEPQLRLLGGRLSVDPRGDEWHARDFVQALGVALYTTDADGRLTYYNEAAAELWGRRPELGELWCGSWRLFWSDGRPMAHDECPMAIALRENRPVRGASAIAERPDGSRVHFQPYPSPLRDDDGHLIGGVNVLIDVTDRQEAMAALESTAAALAISTAARDDFLGLVSHELRTPVTTIYGNARLLLDRLDGLPPQERGMVADIATDADRLLDIVENLLLLSRLQAGAEPEPEPQLIRHVVRKEVDVFMRRHPNRSIRFETRGVHVVVDADRSYLALVIQNLLSNADKYGGDEPIDVSVDTDDDSVRVSIMDRGLGIADLELDELAAPFYRSKEAQGMASGIGLGLTVCRRIVESMGGQIFAAPRVGGGATFGFVLPRSTEPAD